MQWLFDTVDIYCERVDASFLSEPINALSNLSFLIAALYLWRDYKRCGSGSALIKLLVVMCAVIGVGSALFHTFANKLTLLADVFPILIFLCAYVFTFVRVVLAKSIFSSLIVVATFLMLNFIVKEIPQEYSLNGTMNYSVAFTALVLMSFAARRNGLPSKPMFQAIAVFFLSMFARSVDMIICEYFPLGTHFLWHLLNGVLLYLVVTALISQVEHKRNMSKA